MEIVNSLSNITPLSTSYSEDEDVAFKSVIDLTEDYISFFKENYLKNSENKINNYSSICLTDKQKLDDLIYIKKLDYNDKLESFSTTLEDINGLYLTIDGNSDSNTIYPTFTQKDQKFLDPTFQLFEILLLDPLSAKIVHRNRNKTEYRLVYDNDLYFSNLDIHDSVFNYVLDKKNSKLSLFKVINGTLNTLIVENGSLTFSPTLNLFKTNNFSINYYIQQIEPKLNTSWVSYDNRHKNQYQVVADRSKSDLKNNFLITTQYSYVTGNNLDSNILTLKNQKTNKNYSYRSDYLEKNDPNVPNVDNRRYYGLFTGNEQEKGNYSITLGYEFYNADYVFKSDEYTSFLTPETLYPYEKININDLGWNYKGSIAGENPHTSDKIFKNKIDNKKNGGEYLCSWLRKERNGNSVWLDRYYYPDKTSFAKALESTVTYDHIDKISETLAQKLSVNEYYDIPFVYNSLEEEAQHTPQTVKDVIYGDAFFDKLSDLTIEPNQEYIYHRIGDEYVKKILDVIKTDLMLDGLTLKNSNDAIIEIDGDVNDIEYILNNDSYCRIDDYNAINDSHQFTMSFWMNSDNWNEGVGHQILGNLNDKGFALLNDEKITPMIMVQSDKNVYVYNTNFELLDVASLTNENIDQTKIKDIYRTEHLDSYYLVTTKIS